MYPRWADGVPLWHCSRTVWLVLGPNLIRLWADDAKAAGTSMGARSVAVVMNYRIAAYGFLATSELASIDPRGTSGNQGITDLLEALRWIQRNIAAFGGDPTRVTVMGQSSGGTNIFALMAAPEARGLISGGISLSGSPNITMDAAAVQEQGRIVVDNAGCRKATPNETIACLQALTTQQINDATPANWSYAGDVNEGPGEGTPNPPLWPGLAVVDGVTVTKPLPEAYADGTVDAAFILQSAAAEMDFSTEKRLLNWTVDDFNAFVNTRFGSPPWQDGFADALIAEYSGAAHNVTPHGAAFAYYSVDADAALTCADIILGMHAAFAAPTKRTAPVYVSLVTQGPANATGFIMVPGSPGAHWPFHLWDITAGAGLWDVMSPVGYTPLEPDLALGRVMRKGWMQLMTYKRIDGDDTWSWRAVNEPEGGGFPKHYSVFRMGAPGYERLGGGGTSVTDCKADVCATLAKYGVDSRWWWVN